MKISEEQLNEFISIWRNQFSGDIYADDRSKMRIEAESVVSLMKVVIEEKAMTIKK